MAETANTLIKAALRSIGAIASGETPTDAEMQDGLEAMQFMLRNWSASDISLYYTKQESVAMDGSTSYSIGSGGDIDTVRPESIRGAWTSENPVQIVTEDRYRQVRMDAASSPDVEVLWYSPEFPLGLLYPWPKGGSILYVDTLKPLSDPSSLTTSVSFPPHYEDAIRWNLAVRLAPEFEVEASRTVIGLAQDTLSALKKRNFAWQIDSVRPEVIGMSYQRYNINNG